MKKYNVTIPFAGALFVQVEADSPEEAREAAFDKADFKQALQNGSLELELLTHICRGNVCYAPFNNLSVEEEND